MRFKLIILKKKVILVKGRKRWIVLLMMGLWSNRGLDKIRRSSRWRYNGHNKIKYNHWSRTSMPFSTHASTSATPSS